MHGRPRVTQVSDPARQKHEEAKIASFQSLNQDVLRNHRQCNYSKEALLQNAKLLEANPEVYTAWNYRKLAVKHFLGSQQDEAACKSVLDRELHVVERALMRNLKSYGAWHHRKWVLQFGFSSLDHEYRLLDKLLTSDARNFHGWRYRRFLARLKKTTEEQELQYTIKKINENFSNYSAWHNRSVLLSKQLIDNAIEEDKWLQILTDEYDLVKQAFFTEPEDQSGWFYLMWLLSQTVIPSRPLPADVNHMNFKLKVHNPNDVPSGKHQTLGDCIAWPEEDCEQSSSKCDCSAESTLNDLLVEPKRHFEPLSDWQMETLKAQIDTCRELLDLEKDSKWAMLILARLLTVHDNFSNSQKLYMDEVKQLYKALMNVDPTHEHYYKEQLSLLIFDQITSSADNLSKHWCVFQKSNNNHERWLRLNNLSLSKLGYPERLIGVQRLDLSNNKLRSLEGIEMFQLLVNLDVSHNHLSSITSLRPITFLTKLEALNIKYNEIGVHTIDTNRYSCSSALSNSLSKTVESSSTKSLKHYNDWEVLQVFSGLGLRQLDMYGNPVSTNDLCRSQIIEALPSLVWLDGVNVSR